MSFLIDDIFPSGLHTRSHHHSYHHSGSTNNLSRSQPTSSALEIVENDSDIRLTMDLPGVRGRDLDVCVQHGVLCINGSRIERGMDGRIRKKQKLSRRFAVDTDVVDVTKASANINNGVLIISAPKKSRPTKFKIPVTEYETSYVSDCEDEEENYAYSTSSSSSMPEYAVE